MGWRSIFVFIYSTALLTGGAIVGAAHMKISQEAILDRCEARVVEKVQSGEWQRTPAPLPKKDTP